ncbi:MAG: VOC family protein [Alphaproteobacteria bacterium]
MADQERRSGSTAIPCFKYRDATAAMDFLCEAFGFARRFVVPGDGERIAHAELVHGTGMVMLGSSDASDYGRLMAEPDEIGGRATQSAYVVVEDADVHCSRARAAGAEIVIELRDEGHGRSYTCRDPEGHVWTFGTYDPWRDGG